MKTVGLVFVGGMVALLSGCTTSKQVDEMIAASYRDNQEQVALLDAATKEFQETVAVKGASITARLDTMEANVNAVKVLTAANVVSVGMLEKTVDANYKLATSNRSEIEQLLITDQLYRKVLIEHFKLIAATANDALTALEEVEESMEGGDVAEGLATESTVEEETVDDIEEPVQLEVEEPMPAILEPADAEGAVAETNSPPIQ